MSLVGFHCSCSFRFRLVVWLIDVGFLRSCVAHQTVMAAWRTTAGHNAMPTGCDRMPATPRMTTAPRLYRTIALTNPLAAQLCASYCASQQPTPSANSAVPATRPSATAAGVSSPEPSRRVTVADGKHSNATPVPNSITAVTISRRFIGGTFRMPGRLSWDGRSVVVSRSNG